jgi:hypothetical protein
MLEDCNVARLFIKWLWLIEKTIIKVVIVVKVKNCNCYNLIIFKINLINNSLNQHNHCFGGLALSQAITFFVSSGYMAIRCMRAK